MSKEKRLFRATLLPTLLPVAFCVTLASCSTDAEQGTSGGAGEEGTVVQGPVETSTIERPEQGPDLVVMTKPKGKDPEVRGFTADGEPSKSDALTVADIQGNRMLPFADGYAVADKNSIAVLSSEVKKTQGVDVDEIDDEAELAAAATSHTHQSATFAFDLPAEEGGTVERTRVVRMHSADGSVNSDIDSQVITRKGNISSLTSCDDGSAAWLEFNPVSAFDPDGSGLASVVTWTEEDGVESFPLDYTFMGRPWNANQLDCNFKHHRLIAPDGEGGIMNIGVRRSDAEYDVAGRRTIKDGVSAEIDSDHAMIRGDYFTSIDDDGKLTVIDMYKGEVVQTNEFREAFMDTRKVAETSQDGEFFYVLLDQPASDNGNGTAVIVDYSRVSCRVSHELKIGSGATTRAVFAQGSAAIPSCAN